VDTWALSPSLLKRGWHLKLAGTWNWLALENWLALGVGTWNWLALGWYLELAGTWCWLLALTLGIGWHLVLALGVGTWNWLLGVGFWR